MSQARLLTRLEAIDRTTLADWLACAQRDGIDTAIDLSPRRWNIAGDHIIVGIFEQNCTEASWLIVHCSDGWILADCSDGSIPPVAAALSDVLALIGDAPPCYLGA